jgi:glycosyltransferase involved in cell wall biosynthesis
MARIGIDAVPLQRLNGGIGYYLFYLLTELIKLRPNDQLILFIFEKTVEIDVFAKHPNVEIICYSNFSLGHRIWSQTVLSYACVRNKIDLFWGPTQSIPLLKRRGMKTLITIHDFVYRLYPETTPLVSRIYFRLFSKWMLKTANRIIAVSNGTANKLAEFYDLKVNAIIEPPLKTPICIQPRMNFFLENKMYLVSVGTLEPRKNLEALVETYINTLKKVALDQVLPLVIIGSGGWKNGDLLEALDRAKRNFPSHIHLMGYTSDELLASILSGARYTVMMSKYEGYGMPLAESRVCRTAIICTDIPEMREAAEEDGLFLDQNTWEETIEHQFLKETPIRQPKETSYRTNAEKGIQLSRLIDELLDN